MSTGVLVFEPHGDDALISCNELLQVVSKCYPTKLVTLAERTSQDYAAAVGVLYYEYLDLPEVNVHLQSRVNTHEYHKAHISGENTYEKFMREVYEGQEAVRTRVQEVRDVNRKAIQSILRRFCQQFSSPIVVYNVGLDHPYHVLAAELLTEALKEYPQAKVIRYGDKPYLSKRYVREIFQNHPFVCSRRVGNYVKPIQDRDSKLSMFSSFYPTEQGLLRFSRDSIISDPDIYISDISFEEVFNCESIMRSES